MTAWQLIAIENPTLIPEEQARPIFAHALASGSLVLTADMERDRFGIGEPIDIRGTAQEQEITARVFAEAPYLRGLLA